MLDLFIVVLSLIIKQQSSLKHLKLISSPFDKLVKHSKDLEY